MPSGGKHVVPIQYDSSRSNSNTRIVTTVTNHAVALYAILIVYRQLSPLESQEGDYDVQSGDITFNACLEPLRVWTLAAFIIASDLRAHTLPLFSEGWQYHTSFPFGVPGSRVNCIVYLRLGTTVSRPIPSWKGRTGKCKLKNMSVATRPYECIHASPLVLTASCAASPFRFV